MQRWTLILAAAIGVALVGCGGAAGGDYGTSPGTPKNNPTSANTNMITIADQNFSPSSTTVPKGTTVTWVWNSCTGGGYGGYGTCVTHNVTFDDGSNIASPVQDSGSFSRTFTTTGTFKYHCVVHGAVMSGQVTVE